MTWGKQGMGFSNHVHFNKRRLSFIITNYPSSETLKASLVITSHLLTTLLTKLNISSYQYGRLEGFQPFNVWGRQGIGWRWEPSLYHGALSAVAFFTISHNYLSDPKFIVIQNLYILILSTHYSKISFTVSTGILLPGTKSLSWLCLTLFLTRNNL